MPAKSKAQARLFNAVKHNKEFAKKVDIPQSVGKEFSVGGKQYKSLPTVAQYKKEKVGKKK